MQVNLNLSKSPQSLIYLNICPKFPISHLHFIYTYAHIIETPEVSQRINKEYNARMFELYKEGFEPPKPPRV